MESLLFKLGQLRPDQVGHSVADGWGRIGQKLHVPLGIKSSGGIQQADAAFLNQIVTVHTQITLGQVHAPVQLSSSFM